MARLRSNTPVLVQEECMKKRKLLIGFSLFNATVNTVYLVRFFGILPPEEIVHGYVSWFMSFMLPNTFIALSSWVLVISLLRKIYKVAMLSGLLLSGALILHSLNGLTFGFYSGIWNTITFGTLFEMSVYVYGISLATFYITQFWGVIRKYEGLY